MNDNNYTRINKPNPSIMGTKNLFRAIVLFLFAGALMMTSCVKEGPMGLPGLDGKDGVDGTNGQNGVDGTASCIACHNQTNKTLIASQFGNSVHGEGPNVAYAGARSGCATCHSGNGFVAAKTLGVRDLPANLDKGEAFTCATCHTSHQTFDFANDGPDYALRLTDPLKPYMDKTGSVEIDMGSSNICIDCHQPREHAPVANAEGNFTIPNNRFGPHYSTQSVVVEGIWGYTFAQASTAIPGAGSHPHRTAASCNSCHMHDSTNGTVGGHTWNVGPAACSSCHSGITTAEAIQAAKAEYYELFNELGDKLVEKGAMRVTATGSLEPNPNATVPIDVAGALFNYRLLYGDHSGGIHNPAYAKALLKNSIEALN